MSATGWLNRRPAQRH